MTLLISWQLEGVAAAINDAGSQRMRTYRIGHLMARGLER
jgi:two-component system nitrate/nitrite sensor histidine kinase NarX